MTHPTPPKPPEPVISFDFELTDFSDAREALDNMSISVAEQAARPRDSGFWLARRRPKLPTDRALAGVAMDWLMQLPPTARPVKLAEQMPRLANQLAELWADPGDRLAALDALLIDRRGGRHGLPWELRHEVEVLRDFVGGRAG